MDEAEQDLAHALAPAFGGRVPTPDEILDLMEGRGRRSRADLAANTAADADLVRRSLEGDTDAWADVYVKYRTPLYALINSWTPDHALAEDVVHDAFVRAFEQLRRFDSTRPFFRWLATIARNLLHDFHRKNRPTLSLSEEVLPPSPMIDLTLERVLVNEERDTVRSALRRLPKTQLDAVVLADVDDLSYAQVAASVGTSESAAKSLVFRARSMLRRALRTLGGLAWVHHLRTRTRNNAQRIVVIGQAISVEIASAPLLALLGFALVIGEATPLFPARAADAAVATAAARDAGAGQSGLRASPDDLARTYLEQGGVVSARFTRKPPRQGAVVPPSGHLRIQVYLPDGRRFWEDETSYRCGGVGEQFFPDDGPIRAIC